MVDLGCPLPATLAANRSRRDLARGTVVQAAFGCLARRGRRSQEGVSFGKGPPLVSGRSQLVLPRGVPLDGRGSDPARFVLDPTVARITGTPRGIDGAGTARSWGRRGLADAAREPHCLTGRTIEVREVEGDGPGPAAASG